MALIISLFILFVILDTFDYITTNIALKKGCTERNKIVRFLIRKYGSKWGYIKLLLIPSIVGAGLFTLWYISYTTAAIITIVVCNLWYSLLAINNIIAIWIQGCNNS